MTRKPIILAGTFAITALLTSHIFATSHAQTAPRAISDIQSNLQLSQSDQDLLLSLLQDVPNDKRRARLVAIDAQWTNAFIPAALDIFNFVSDEDARRLMLRKLRESTGQDFGNNTNAWYRWLWNQPESKIAGYDNFKGTFYDYLDPHFETYFKDRGDSALIRLDEIRWGGVRQDGIPPLRQPKMISAKEAIYLDDDDIIFGIEVNGDIRAYPKRILAWHEMFVDEVGGVDFAGVYCTLCGTVILYETDLNGQSYNMGTSGFLYRSNKLMYDKKTQSLWNTLKGEPVLGPLAGKGIALKHQSVVTTTWGKWSARNPDTQVLSLDTGYDRDYGEGVAYHNYFATDALMFNTPFQDTRLKNKQEVLALRFAKDPFNQLAISTNFLKNNPVYTGAVGEQKFVVLTDETGANRVYDPGALVFQSFDGNNSATDVTGQVWTVTESKLSNTNGETLPRLPYHRAFWFGWHATYPESKLIQ